MCYSATVLTVADGAQCIIVIHTLADDPPLGEHRIGADRARIEGTPCAHQVVCADVTLVAADGKVPVGQGKCGVTQHVLQKVDKTKQGQTSNYKELHFKKIK